MLLDAADDDETAILMQEDEYKHFIDSVGLLSGVGPN